MHTVARSGTLPAAERQQRKPPPTACVFVQPRGAARVLNADGPQPRGSPAPGAPGRVITGVDGLEQEVDLAEAAAEQRWARPGPVRTGAVALAGKTRPGPVRLGAPGPDW
ncbi:hypothetical protein GCM10009760_55830 [Kitasatospora kazusensis]|uniref:Uncharacterized protein n=1 Tax=Kitasatospora kazusensis TaxID=407974 RepID=A0ABN3A8E1_9ACTN